MIRLADDDNIALLKKFCKAEDVMACRISCLCESWYGIDKDALFWLQYSEEGTVTAAVSGCSSELMIYAADSADRRELKEFSDVLGRESILSNARLDDAMQADVAVMRYAGEQKNEQNIISDTEIPFREIYALLSACRAEDFAVPSYEEFLLELSHRLRHHTAICHYCREQEMITAFCMTSALSETTAVIGAVCTAPSFRRRGLGRLCMKKLISSLGSRKIYIMRDKKRNEQFYSSIGFENCGWIYQG